ncbi:MAG TPA: hypothetical protein VJN71_04950 [Nitrososphaerales archaeon]|nr:hypothetical protein [Nitrososphaerales archaeon]
MSIRSNGREGIFDTFINSDGTVRMTYNKEIVDYCSDQDLNSFLKHEACHILTIPSSEIVVHDTGRPEMVDFTSQHVCCFDEFLAHQEFIRRWPNNEDFLDYKRRECSNYEIILYSLRHILRKGRIPNPLYPHKSLSELFQDALYLKLINSPEWDRVFAETNSSAVSTFLGYWLADFKQIQSFGEIRSTTQDMVELSAILSISVSSEDLLLNNKVVFSQEASVMFSNFLFKYKNPNYRAVIRSWMNRAI